jgi:hypothetical protein
MKTNYMNRAEFQKGWVGGGRETPCGSGSKMSETKVQRKWLPEMVAKYGIESIADLGAGDLNWARHTAFGCDYTPYDLILRTQGVEKLDILTDKLPKADCLMVLWVLNHFVPEQQKAAIDKLQQSKARYLIMTWDNRMEPCTDLPYIEKAVLRRDTTKRVDFEIRLIEL